MCTFQAQITRAPGLIRALTSADHDLEASTFHTAIRKHINIKVARYGHLGAAEAKHTCRVRWPEWPSWLKYPDHVRLLVMRQHVHMGFVRLVSCLDAQQPVARAIAIAIYLTIRKECAAARRECEICARAQLQASGPQAQLGSSIP